MAYSNKYLLNAIKTLYDYLNKRDVKYDEQGFPILKKEWFLTEKPNQLVPYNHRNDKSVIDKSKTVICHYCADKDIYPRINKIFKDLPEYKKFLAVVQTDITVTSDMDIELQNAIMLLNCLYLAVLGVNGIKIVANTRCGSSTTITNLKCVPKGVMWASGFLGCNKSRSVTEAYQYLDKIINIQPSYLLIYGKHDKLVEEFLTNTNTTYKRYVDYHRWKKEVK